MAISWYKDKSGSLFFYGKTLYEIRKLPFSQKGVSLLTGYYPNNRHTGFDSVKDAKEFVKQLENC